MVLLVDGFSEADAPGARGVFTPGVLMGVSGPSVGVMTAGG